MKIALLAFAALSLPITSAAAADQLTPAQLDTVTAGQILGVDCPGCTFSSATSTSTNGITVSTNGTTTVPGGSGSTGGSGGSGTDTGSGGNSGGGGGGLSVQTTVGIPATLSAVITAATTPTVSKP